MQSAYSGHVRRATCADCGMCGLTLMALSSRRSVGRWQMVADGLYCGAKYRSVSTPVHPARGRSVPSQLRFDDPPAHPMIQERPHD